MQIRYYHARQHESLMRFVLRQCKELWQYRFALKNIVSTTLEQNHRRSVLGFAWSFLNPLFNLVILAVVFSTLFKQDIRDFAMYLFSGLLTWNFMTGVITSSAHVFIGAEGFLKKIYTPKLLFLISNLLTALVNFGFSIICYFILGFAVGFNFQSSMYLSIFSICITTCFAFGVGMIIAIFNVYFRDLQHIASVLLSGMVWLSPVMYKIDLLPEEWKVLMYFNPFYYFLILIRNDLYAKQYVSDFHWGMALLLTLVSLFLGFLSLKAHNDRIIYHL